MKGSRSSFVFGAVLLFWIGWIAFSGVSTANLTISKEAKALGYPVQNCQYCHIDKLPKKDAHAPNDRGKWLIAEKEKRHAKEVDPAWLKDYPGGKN
jgi:hypothetical protein